MPYTPTTWTDEVPSGALKFQIIDDVHGHLGDSASIALVTSVIAGTPLNATNMNKIESGIVTAQALAEALQTALSGLYATVSRVASQSLADSTFVDIIHDTQVEDVGGNMWVSGSPTIFTVPAAGRYAIGCMIEYANNNTGIRETRLIKNGAGYIVKDTRAPIAGGTTAVLCSVQTTLAINDTIKMAGWQSSGGALGITALMWITRMAKV